MVASKDIEDCLRVLARLCEAYGEPYWATFELFEKEHTKRQAIQERISTYTKRLSSKPIDGVKANISENHPNQRPKDID